MTIQTGTRTTSKIYAGTTGTGQNGQVTLEDVEGLVVAARAQGIPAATPVQAPGIFTVSPITSLRFLVDVVEDTGATPGETD